MLYLCLEDLGVVRWDSAAEIPSGRRLSWNVIEGTDRLRAHGKHAASCPSFGYRHLSGCVASIEQLRIEHVASSNVSGSVCRVVGNEGGELSIKLAQCVLDTANLIGPRSTSWQNPIAVLIGYCWLRIGRSGGDGGIAGGRQLA